MIILYTNILSELMHSEPNVRVLNWVNSQPISMLGITAITISEILYGIEKLSEGKRKISLLSIAKRMFDEDFNGRIFPFNERAAIEYSILVLKREKSGSTISMADAIIASISIMGGHSLATRNTKDFKSTGIHLINPWND